MERTQIVVQQPKIFQALRQGYQTVSQRLYLILFPLLLDLFYLFGLKLKIEGLFASFIDRISQPVLADNLLEQWQALVDMMRDTFQGVSLTSILRTNPVGIPSLFSNRIFETNLLKNSVNVEIRTFGQVALYTLLLFALGIFLTTIFYKLIAHATHKEETPFSWRKLGQNFLNFLVLPFAYLLMASLIFFPGMFIVSLAMVIFPFLGSILYIALLVFLISILIPVVFAPHSVVTKDLSLIKAMRHSATNIKTFRRSASLFLFAVFGISYLTDILWNLPKDGSWMLLIGAFGHALVSTILLVSSFHFFADAQTCTTKFLEISAKPEILA